ncbi:MAG: hypothetical protein JW793_06415 [Acidobacteria bacterium]|nr:hypothetical protein [Acidobacteriota bacterium]
MKIRKSAGVTFSESGYAWNTGASKIDIDIDLPDHRLKRPHSQEDAFAVGIMRLIGGMEGGEEDRLADENGS